MSVMPLEYVAPPAVVPAKYGILSAAVVIDDSDPHMGFGFQYDPDFCGPARPTAALCMEQEEAKVAEDGRNVVDGDPFAVYSLHSCRTIGIRDAADRATRALTSGEGRAVEEWLGEKLAAEADDQSNWTASSPVEALAALEHFIHCNYGGRGTIHMNRGTASGLLSDRALDTEGTQLVTRLGNLVSAGCYDVSSGDTMYATGTVMLRRGPVFTPPDPVIDHAHNEQYALAERPYAGSWECFAVAIRVGDV